MDQTYVLWSKNLFWTSNLNIKISIFQYARNVSGFEQNPTSSQFIEALADIAVKSSSQMEGKECSICLKIPEIGDILHQLPCKHLFHKSCIIRWLTKVRQKSYNSSKFESLNHIWIKFESCLNQVWIKCKSSLNHVWITFESSLNHIWITFESSLNLFLSNLDQFMSTMPNRISIPTPKSNCQVTTQRRIWGQTHPRKSRKRSKYATIELFLNKTSRSKSYCICQSSKTFIKGPKCNSCLCLFASTMEFEWNFLVVSLNIQLKKPHQICSRSFWNGSRSDPFQITSEKSI